ncbi:hypothetical protein [Foetidibacter luteolus]|uniref:hypothetical protein n=1 Tax=Foetidibacter luteolus TaxID=2608880 RepID=UPI00129AFFC3|nr:hypothetical protein [Foetidibacter luteolus]
MRKVLPAIFCLAPCFAKAQLNDSTIILKLRRINHQVSGGACNTGNGRLISNRAMNLFLSDKVGSYLSNTTDLSLFKNNLTLNTGTGSFNVNHNFYNSNKPDEPAKKFFSAGASANLYNTYNAAINNRKYNNELGFTVKHTWMGKTASHYSCTAQSSSTVSHKTYMDVQRSLILRQLETELTKDSREFETTLDSLYKTRAIPADTAGYYKAVKDPFYQNLEAKYIRRFADMQCDALLESNSYNSISTSWTSLFAYLPVLKQHAAVTPGLTAKLQNKKSYPLEAGLYHTRFWEIRKAGRFFLTGSITAFLNNSAKADLLKKITQDEYRRLGGADSASLKAFTGEDIYTGAYSNFITPAAAIRLVYYPPSSHIGISVSAEKNMGTYHPFNLCAGMPVVLINKQGKSSFNIEFRVSSFDVTNQVRPDKSFGEKTSVAVLFGIPFSNIVY